MNNKPPSNNKRELYRYASLGTQILAGLALAVFIGIRIDKWLNTLPLFGSVLPLLVLSGMFYKLYRETSRKKNDKQH
jgi:F0F1-type ATP synthase assembly protein I